MPDADVATATPDEQPQATGRIHIVEGEAVVDVDACLLGDADALAIVHGHVDHGLRFLFDGLTKPRCAHLLEAIRARGARVRIVVDAQPTK